MVKITELIKSEKQISFSLEVTPDITEEEIDMLDVKPTFYSITWHAKSHKCRDLDIEPLRVAKLLATKGKHVLLHLSCDMLKAEYLKQLLALLQEQNICNLFVMLGEHFDPTSSDFESTLNLIKSIREQSGNYFCIGVAGFPGCSDEKLLQTKTKIECGSDFIITQAFFDINTFKHYKERCNNIDMNVPIIPGIFPFQSYKQLIGFINLCKIKVSDDLLETVKTLEKSNDSCTDISMQIIKNLNVQCQTSHFHFFTLNKLQKINTFIKNLKQIV